MFKKLFTISLIFFISHLHALAPYKTKFKKRMVSLRRSKTLMSVNDTRDITVFFEVHGVPFPCVMDGLGYACARVYKDELEQRYPEVSLIKDSNAIVIRVNLTPDWDEIDAVSNFPTDEIRKIVNVMFEYRPVFITNYSIVNSVIGFKKKGLFSRFKSDKVVHYARYDVSSSQRIFIFNIENMKYFDEIYSFIYRTYSASARIEQKQIGNKIVFKVEDKSRVFSKEEEFKISEAYAKAKHYLGGRLITKKELTRPSISFKNINLKNVGLVFSSNTSVSLKSA